MLKDNTIFSWINKLSVAHYILVEDREFEITQYYKLYNTPNCNQLESQIIDNINKLFRQAIKRAFDKERGYRYNIFFIIIKKICI